MKPNRKNILKHIARYRYGVMEFDDVIVSGVITRFMIVVSAWSCGPLRWAVRRSRLRRWQSSKSGRSTLTRKSWRRSGLPGLDFFFLPFKFIMPQPIETAPKDGTVILTDVGIVRSPYPKQQRKQVVWYFCTCAGDEFADEGYEYEAYPTLWEPLPSWMA